jgi:predicted phage baseplate assembly protein
VATKRGADHPAVTFSLAEDLAVVPCDLAAVSTAAAGQDPVDRTRAAEPFPTFSEPPQPGDAVIFDLSAAVPRCAVRLELACDEAYGHGVDPLRPPLGWEAWDGGEWRELEDVTDTTAALNRPGEVVLHVPEWAPTATPTRLRCVIVARDVPAYRESPRIAAASADTIGGTAPAIHGEAIEDELLGTSTGHPRQRFLVQRPPLVGQEPLVVQSRHADGDEEYAEVESFADSDEQSLHVTVDRSSGEIVFGPSIREGAEARPTQRGKIPPPGAQLWVRRYVTGGGEEGNVARGELRILKTTVPFVTRVENRGPALGGAAAESVEDACARGPIALRTRERAVTAEDYEYFALRAVDAVGRVRCVPPPHEEPGAPAQIVLVPELGDSDGAPSLAELVVPNDVKEAVRAELESRRVLGARFVVRDATYRGVRVDALVRVLPGYAAAEVAERATQALHAYFHPTRGGSDGRGWAFGRDVYDGMAYMVLQRVAGVEIVQDLKLYPVDLANGAIGDDSQRIPLPADAMLVSGDHRVAVVEEKDE